MATESYNVLAKLELGAQQAVKGLDGIIKKLDGLKGAVQKINFGFGGLVTKALAFGAAYFGISAIVRGVKSFASGVLAASAETEGLTASLATVYSAVEKVSFAKATEDAQVLFKVFERVAIQSTATTTELMQVFQGIYGPLRNAGLTIQQIVDTTNNAAVAAAALGVDFAQASRDISAMARGTAGLDVKTFSLLQSMGLIKETTEQWNALAPDKRAKKLMDVMGKIGGQAAEAYGRTWKGLSSTFVDIMGAFKRAFGTAVFERLKKTLEQVNAYLLTNRTRIEGYLRTLGERVGAVFDRVINNASRAFSYVTAHVDSIRAKIAELYARFEHLKPIIAEGAKIAMALSVASFALSTVSPILNLMFGVFKAAPLVVSGMMSMAGSLAGAFTWIVTKISMLGVIFEGLGAGGVMSALGGSLSALAGSVLAALAPFAAIAAVIAALVLGFLRFKDTIMSMLQPLLETFKSIGGQLYSIFKDLWVAVKPILEVIGGVLLMQLIMGFRIMAWVVDNLLLPPLRLAAKIIRWVFEAILQPIFEALIPVMKAVVSGFEWLGEQVESLVGIIRRAIGWISDKLDAVGDALGDAWDFLTSPISLGTPKATGQGSGPPPWFTEMMAKQRAAAEAAIKARDAAAAKKAADAAAAAKQQTLEKSILQTERPSTVNDFRGSKIEVKQEFREADPDNVWVQFREGLEREAVSRTRSGFADPLAR
jgi:hypothetical protein